MTEIQQVLDGGVGAMVFYGIYKGVELIGKLITGKSKNGKVPFCGEHGVLCAHLEEIKVNVNETKEAVVQLIKDVAKLQGQIGS